MIKKFAIILSCGFLTFSIQAQDFGGGVILGLSTSQVGGDDLAGFHKAGLLLGVFANKSITELLSFQMEMTYIQKGSNNPNMNNPEHPNLLPDISLSYIEVPLLLQYHQSDKLKIEGGVLTAYLVDGYYNDFNGKMPNAINPFISYDIGLLLGIDYKYSENISLNTRIGNSILPIGSEDYENQVPYNSSKKGKYNSVLSFALHYNF
jgi:hypothetical protein